MLSSYTEEKSRPREATDEEDGLVGADMRNSRVMTLQIWQPRSSLHDGPCHSVATDPLQLLCLERHLIKYCEYLSQVLTCAYLSMFGLLYGRGSISSRQNMQCATVHAGRETSEDSKEQRILRTKIRLSNLVHRQTSYHDTARYSGIDHEHMLVPNHFTPACSPTNPVAKLAETV